MNGGEIYYLVKTLLEYIPKKEVEQAVYACLKEIEDSDSRLLNEFEKASIEEEDDGMMDYIKSFKEDYGIYEDEDAEEDW